MKRNRHLALLILIALALSAGAATAGVADLPGIETAASMKEWLKLTDDQVTKLVPVIDTRITKVDAALAKLDAAEEPDVLAFVEEYGTIKKEFDAGVTNILTPDQSKQWGSFKAELEKDLAQAGAKKKLSQLQPALKLTDEQVTKLQPSMATAVQAKIDVVQKLAGSGRISARDKLSAKRALDGLNAELEKSMSAVLSPDQLAGYKAATAKKK